MQQVHRRHRHSHRREVQHSLRSIYRDHPPSLGGAGSAKPETRERKYGGPGHRAFPRTTVCAGLSEHASGQIKSAPVQAEGADRRIRAPGGGSKKLVEKDDSLLQDLDAAFDPVSRGDPMSPLRWTSKSTS